MENETLSEHICDRPGKISRSACCHFVSLLNDSTKIPLCEDSMTSTPSAVLPNLFTNSYSTPVYLNFPPEVPEDHITFLFGTLLLISVAVFCAIVIMKLTKPKLGFARLPASMSFPRSSSLDYDIFMWLPRHQRRNSMMLFLRSMGCRPAAGRQRQTSLSVVSSNSSFGFLPTYRSAITPSSIPPPPPYEELETLNSSQSTATSYVSFGENSERSSLRSNLRR